LLDVLEETQLEKRNHLSESEKNDTLFDLDHLKTASSNQSTINEQSSIAKKPQLGRLLNSYELNLLNEIDLKRSKSNTSKKFELTRSLNIRSVNGAGSSLSTQTKLSDPRVYNTTLLRKNSYLIRKSTYKSYMTESIPKLLQSYSVL
jgi:hypothetical protein